MRRVTAPILAVALVLPPGCAANDPAASPRVRAAASPQAVAGAAQDGEARAGGDDEADAAPAADVAPAPWPAADPADVATIDGLVAALYDVISGPAGAPRDWNRMASLFHPTVGRLTPMGRRRAGGFGARAMTPADYRAGAEPYFERTGFFELELARVEERFGHLAHVFSTYETRESVDGEVLQRGINSLQLLWDEQRWWVLSITWDVESAEQPLPARYLP